MAPGLWLSHRQWGQSSRKRPVCVGQEAHRELFLGALGFKLDLEKGEEPEIKLPTSAGSQEKQENSRKTSTSVSLTTLKSLTVWITTNWKILRDGNTRPPDLPLEIKKQQLELDTEQWAGSKLGKEYIKTVYCPPAYLIYMQSTS